MVSLPSENRCPDNRRTPRAIQITKRSLRGNQKYRLARIPVQMNVAAIIVHTYIHVSLNRFHVWVQAEWETGEHTSTDLRLCARRCERPLIAGMNEREGELLAWMGLCPQERAPCRNDIKCGWPPAGPFLRKCPPLLELERRSLSVDP